MNGLVKFEKTDDDMNGKFPLDALPEEIQRFAQEAAASLPAAPELVAIPALVVVAAAIGSSRVIRLKADWTEPSSLWVAVVSPSGTMKSPALRMATEPLQSLDSQGKRTWTTDVTVERLASLLAENPRGLLVIRDELSAWFKSMNQYRQGKGADRQFYLSVWGGASVKVDRVGTGVPSQISVERPCLSVVGCVPPEVLEELDDRGGIDDGFLPRLLFTWPPQRPVRWTDAIISKEARDRYVALIAELFRLGFDGGPIAIPLTEEAQGIFVKWHDAHSQEIERSSLPPFLKASYSKLKGYCARLALIHALASNPTADRIEKASIEAAIRLTTYFKGQAARVMPLICRKTSGEVDRCKAEIRRKLSVTRSMKRRNLQRGSAFDAEIFKRALAEMESPEVIKDTDGEIRLWGPTNRQEANRRVESLPNGGFARPVPNTEKPDQGPDLDSQDEVS